MGEDARLYQIEKFEVTVKASWETLKTKQTDLNFSQKAYYGVETGKAYVA